MPNRYDLNDQFIADDLVNHAVIADAVSVEANKIEGLPRLIGSFIRWDSIFFTIRIASVLPGAAKSPSASVSHLIV